MSNHFLAEAAEAFCLSKVFRLDSPFSEQACLTRFIETTGRPEALGPGEARWQ